MVSDTDNPHALNNEENIMTVFQCVGVDVAKDKFDVAIFLNKKNQHRCFSNDKKGRREFLKLLRAHTETPWVCMEATGHYSEVIAEFLSDNNIRASIVNPLQIKNFARMKLTRNKNDIIDAQIIQEFCQIMKPQVFLRRSDEQKELKDLTKVLDTLKDQLVRLKNQLESTLGKLAKKTILKLIKQLEKEIKSVESQLDGLVKSKEDLNEKMKLITSIKGVGKVTAYKIIAQISDINNFGHAKQFAAYIGITPKQHQSGKYQGKTTISRIGDSRLRKALYMAALVAKRHNQALAPFVKRLQDKGKAPKSIICAVMRKLAHLIFGILKSGQTFNAELV